MIDRNTVLNLCQQSSDINEYLMTIYNLVVQENHKTVVELGCGYSTAALLAGVNKTNGHLYSFDMAESSLNRSGFRKELYEDNHFSFTEIDDMKAVKIWDKLIDFLFFDTSHIYEATKKEINVWFPWVRKGGQIFMHDTAHESGDGMGCRKALNEFLLTEEGKKYVAVHLLDTKILGATVLTKLYE